MDAANPMLFHSLASIFNVLIACLIGINGIYREQWRSQIAYFFQQSMQCSLIDHCASQERIAVIFQCDGQSFKPFCPLMTQMALDPDLIDHWLIWINVLGCVYLTFCCSTVMTTFPLPLRTTRRPVSRAAVCSSVYAVAAARMRLSGFTVFTPTTSRYRTIQISAMVGTMTMNGWICSWKSGTRNAVIRCTR